MTQTEKDLLLKDLCARIPYGLKCQKTAVWYSEGHEIEKVDTVTLEVSSLEKDYYTFYKPYLFPMSLMTKEQYNQYIKYSVYEGLDWLNKNHFDYRGLIPMGLAIDATGLNVY